MSNAVQELQPEESLSKAAQFYCRRPWAPLKKMNVANNADLAKIELQYQQSRKKGGKEEEPEEVAEA